MKSNDNSPALGKTTIAKQGDGYRAAFACDGGHMVSSASNQTYEAAVAEMDAAEKSRQMYLAHQVYSVLKDKGALGK